MSGTGHRTLQVHPTRLCNLACTHCYTESGPQRREHLSSALLGAVVADAATLGYSQLAVSGGEPLLYPELGALIQHGHRHGMAVAVTTNGTLPVTAPRRALLADVDLLAVSVDGDESGHDAVRGRNAFARTRRTVESIHAAGIAWGAIFTLTHGNLDQLPSVVAFAANHGARFVQVHALDATGRAAARAADVPDEIELAAALAVAHATGALQSIPVLVDVVTAAHCRTMPSLAVPLPQTLIVDPDGNIVPLHHDLHPRHRLGHTADGRLTDQLERWHTDGRAARLRAVEQAARDRLGEPGAPTLLAWPDVLAATSRDPALERALLPIG